MAKPDALQPADLRALCDPSLFEFNSTAQLDPLEEVIGQQRAVQAIEFGLGMTSAGYNIFVTGIEGTGRSTIAQDLVGRHARKLATPADWCLVNNFQDEFRPVPVALPPGTAPRFCKQMQQLIQGLSQRLPKAFEEEPFLEKKTAVQQRFEAQEQKLVQQMEEAAKARGMALHKSAEGIQPLPLHEGQPLSRQAFDQLPESEQQALEKAMAELNDAIAEVVGEIRKTRQALGREMEKLIDQVTRHIVHDRLEALGEAYQAAPDVLQFLADLEEDLVENVGLFLPGREAGAPSGEGLLPGGPPTLDRYRVNLLVDRSGLEGAPVIFEPNPSFRNLFGWIEKRIRMGALVTDFSMVQAGSLLQANGGFLIMEIESVLLNPMVWEALKRSLQNKQLFIEDPGANDGPATAALRPQPIDLDLKIILIGGYQTFELLQNHDSRFNELFKVRADFDYEVIDSPETVHQYARFIARVCRQENLRHFSPDGVAAVVEYCKKIAGHQKKLSLRFGPIVSIIKEADYWAREEKKELITSRQVYRAFEQHRFRYNLYEEKVHQSYVDQTVLIDVQGEVVGQVNALAVYQMGEISFGRPSRITAETYMGKNGIINIEREARLSGSTHDKGVMILSGYLGRTFARNRPMCLCASLTFEQSYSGVDGDSASSTELYAILSSLADVPIRQGMAVTGSVNQKGRIQAIGGVNQKVEGFFEVCKSLGLNGRQGVLIPAANVQNLMLKQEVIQAVAEGRFHLYAVSTIEQGLEILTGVPTGAPDESGDYPEGTLYHRVHQQLAYFYKQALQWQKAAQLL